MTPTLAQVEFTEWFMGLGGGAILGLGGWIVNRLSAISTKIASVSTEQSGMSKALETLQKEVKSCGNSINQLKTRLAVVEVTDCSCEHRHRPSRQGDGERQGESD